MSNDKTAMYVDPKDGNTSNQDIGQVFKMWKGETRMALGMDIEEMNHYFIALSHKGSDKIDAMLVFPSAESISLAISGLTGLTVGEASEMLMNAMQSTSDALKNKRTAS